MYTHETIPDGTYEGNPTTCGTIWNKEHTDQQYIIEVGVKVPIGRNDAGEVEYEVVLMNKYCNIKTDEGLGYTLQDLETCGADISNGQLQDFIVDPNVTVICKVSTDEYGKKLRSIFPNTPREAGYLIKKSGLSSEESKTLLTDVNSRLAALRARRQDNQPIGQVAKGQNTPAGQATKPSAAQQTQSDAQTKEKMEKRKRVPI